jgi:hypothetical protein
VDFISLISVALVKRLSVRGTQKRDKKSFTGRASIFFPLTIFLVRFWAFLDKGNSKTRLKKSRLRTCTKVHSGPNKARTYIGWLGFFFFCRPLLPWCFWGLGGGGALSA